MATRSWRTCWCWCWLDLRRTLQKALQRKHLYLLKTSPIKIPFATCARWPAKLWCRNWWWPGIFVERAQLRSFAVSIYIFKIKLADNLIRTIVTILDLRFQLFGEPLKEKFEKEEVPKQTSNNIDTVIRNTVLRTRLIMNICRRLLWRNVQSDCICE